MIPVGNYHDKIYVIYQSKADFPEHANLAVMRYSGGFSMTGLGFQAGSDSNLYEAKTIIKTETEDELEPLYITIDKQNKYLSHYWGEKNKQDNPDVVKEYPLKAGKPFPEMQIRNENNTMNLGKASGHLLVVNWWATTCSACIDEIPGLNILVEKYKDKGVHLSGS